MISDDLSVHSHLAVAVHNQVNPDIVESGRISVKVLGPGMPYQGLNVPYLTIDMFMPRPVAGIAVARQRANPAEGDHFVVDQMKSAIAVEGCVVDRLEVSIN